MTRSSLLLFLLLFTAATAASATDTQGGGGEKGDGKPTKEEMMKQVKEAWGKYHTIVIHAEVIATKSFHYAFAIK